MRGKLILRSLIENGSLGSDPELLCEMLDLCQTEQGCEMFEPTILPMDVTACHAIIHRERANYLEYRSRVVSDREVYLQVVRDLEARLKEMQDRILALQFGHDLQLRVA